jgi:hypothetical protein
VNNLAICFAQHPIHTPVQVSTPGSDKSSTPTGIPKTRPEFLSAAQNWARNAYAHAMQVQGEERTVECDEACAVSLCNLGDILALMGRKEEARERFTECIEMCKKIDFQDGVRQAQLGLTNMGKLPN